MFSAIIFGSNGIFPENLNQIGQKMYEKEGLSGFSQNSVPRSGNFFAKILPLKKLKKKSSQIGPAVPEVIRGQTDRHPITLYYWL